MTTIFVSEGAEKNHAALVGMALPLLPPGWRDRALHVADGGCTPPSCRRDDDLVQLVPGDATLLCRGNGAGIRLQYDPAALGTACAALVAAATQAGMPVAADSETLALLTLTFLALGAHLLWFELLVESYRLLPAGGGALPAAAGMRMVEFAGAAFTTAAAIALPMVLVLLLVQLATGVLSRSAPSLNLFALGLPAGVLAGLAALIAALPVLSAQFATLAEDAVLQAAALIRP